MEPDTAKFSWGDRSITVDLTDCGREGDTFVAGASDTGSVLQIGVDLGEDGQRRSGITADLGPDDGIWGAFGADMEQGPAGELGDIEVDGDRLTVQGEWVRFDGNLVPDTSQQPIEGELVARCPEAESASYR